MALFSEYAVTPDVFNLKACYNSRALVGNTDFRQLKQDFFN